MIEKIVIKNFIDNNGIYYKVREKRKLGTDYGIFKDYKSACRRVKQLNKKRSPSDRTSREMCKTN